MVKSKRILSRDRGSTIFMLVLLNLPEYPFAKLINLFSFLFCLSFNVPQHIIITNTCQLHTINCKRVLCKTFLLVLYLYNLRLFSILMEGSRGLKLTPQQYCRSRLSYSSLPPHLTINKAYIDKARYTKAKSNE